MILPVRANTTL